MVRTAAAATSSLPPLAPLDGKEREQRAQKEEANAESVLNPVNIFSSKGEERVSDFVRKASPFELAGWICFLERVHHYIDYVRMQIQKRKEQHSAFQLASKVKQSSVSNRAPSPIFSLALNLFPLPPLPPLPNPKTPDSYPQTHSFSDVAHWIVPGALMVGRYPYVEPSRCSNREVGEEQMKDILERGGVRKFVCLQAELPPQEQMPVGGVKGFLPYRPTATLIAAALSGPPSLEVMEGLRNPHLDAFLPPRRKADRHAKDANHMNAEAERLRIDISFAHRPLEDMEVPKTTREIRDIVDEEIAPFLTKKGGQGGGKENSGGGVLYLHCWGGRGRAGMVAAATLARLYGIPADEALERVDRALKTREPGGRAPQTDEQVEFVRQFIREL